MKFDLRSILNISFIYDSYQKIVGGYNARKIFANKYVNAKEGDKILDIGCGTGHILEYIPHVDYHGYDLSPVYIDTAKKKYSDRGTFYCSEVSELNLNDKGTYDIVISSGVLHHLNDNESKKLFELAYKALKPGGYFISHDGCFTKRQHPIDKLFLKLDRGQFIRNQSLYLNLAHSSFKNVTSFIEKKFFYIPYTTIILKCVK